VTGDGSAPLPPGSQPAVGVREPGSDRRRNGHHRAGPAAAGPAPCGPGRGRLGGGGRRVIRLVPRSSWKAFSLTRSGCSARTTPTRSPPSVPCRSGGNAPAVARRTRARPDGAASWWSVWVTAAGSRRYRRPGAPRYAGCRAGSNDPIEGRPVGGVQIDLRHLEVIRLGHSPMFR
jgi:hypothetical protein